MSSIIRRRRALISAIGNSSLRGWAAKNPRSSQTGGDYCDRPSTAAPAASFNPKRVKLPEGWYEMVMSEIARLAKARGWGPRLFFDQIAALLPLGGYVK